MKMFIEFHGKILVNGCSRRSILHRVILCFSVKNSRFFIRKFQVEGALVM